MNVTKEDVENALSNVMDPELNISIVDLGLIYEVHLNGKFIPGGENASGEPTSLAATDPTAPIENVHIVMTLTTLGCPLFGTIESDIKKNVGALGFTHDNIELELVFDPPWSMERMSESAKAMLGI